MCSKFLICRPWSPLAAVGHFGNEAMFRLSSMSSLCIVINKCYTSLIFSKRLVYEQRHMSGFRTLDEFGNGRNTIQKYLKSENNNIVNGANLFPHQVKNVHFTYVYPEPVSSPFFIVASKSCAEMLELDCSEIGTKKFVNAFSGNLMLPGLSQPYATVYGCHCYGQWFGQLGDGRAISIGEVYAHKPTKRLSCAQQLMQDTAINKSMVKDHYGDHIYELQLKGCGRTPFSRGFDGRAVLRSSVREYLGKQVSIYMTCLDF